MNPEMSKVEAFAGQVVTDIVSVIVEFEGFGSVFDHFGRGEKENPLEELDPSARRGLSPLSTKTKETCSVPRLSR